MKDLAKITASARTLRAALNVHAMMDSKTSRENVSISMNAKLIINVTPMLSALTRSVDLIVDAKEC